MFTLFVSVIVQVAFASVPAGTWALLAAIALVPVAAFVLYWIDVTRGDGSVTVLGSSRWSEER
jgi:hypothetical protein